VQRRSFLAGFAALALAGRAGAQRVYRIGVLANGTEHLWGSRVAALRAGLKERGYVEGRNIVLIIRWNVCGPVLSAAALQKASRTIPIVLGTGAGLVKTGLAKSFARPGGNVTGIESSAEDVVSKHIELLKLVAPRVSRVGILTTGNFMFYEEAWNAARNAAKALKMELTEIRLSTLQDVARLDGKCGNAGCDALYTLSDPVTINWRAEIVQKVASLRLPAMYFQPEFVERGGLMSYSANIDEMFRKSADYVDRILKGAKPADLPIELASKFELTINLGTARSLGLDIPGDVLARADRLIR
jgi:putative ABC transport system substrate-binding protein